MHQQCAAPTCISRDLSPSVSKPANDLEDHKGQLNEIQTEWELVRQAHEDTARKAVPARQQLLAGYAVAIYRYLLGALHDEDAAADLTQDFAVRMMRGDFRRANCLRGRFRDYLRTALINMVNQYYRDQRRRQCRMLDPNAAPCAAGQEAPESESGSLSGAIERVWGKLADEYQLFYSVLVVRVEFPDWTAAQIAEHLTEITGRQHSAVQIRVARHRGARRFAELLVAEVCATLPSPTEDQLASELRNLGIWRCCTAVIADGADQRG